MKIKSAFTLVELSVAFVLIAFVGLLSFNSFTKLDTKAYKLKIKTANVALQNALNNLVSNPVYYSDLGFVDTSEVKFRGDDAENVEYQGDKKFRFLLLKELGVSIANQNLECIMIDDSFKSERSFEFTKSSLCYRADNDVIWAIPDTNFKDKGVVESENVTGNMSLYTPITVYPFYSKNITEEDFKRYAIVFGVRSDGAVKILTTIDCDSKANKSFLQCNLEEVFGSVENEYKTND